MCVLSGELNVRARVGPQIVNVADVDVGSYAQSVTMYNQEFVWRIPSREVRREPRQFGRAELRASRLEQQNPTYAMADAIGYREIICSCSMVDADA